MTGRASYDVVVVGGGPVGVGLALDLGLRGVSCAVVERRPALSAVPKGRGLSPRPMEHMHRWGISDRVRAARAMPEGYPIGQVTVYETLVGELWHAPPGASWWRPTPRRTSACRSTAPNRCCGSGWRSCPASTCSSGPRKVAGHR